VSVPKLDKLPEPRNLGALKAEVERRWGTIDLLDILKDTAFITDFTDSFASVASREVLDRGTLNRRLLLVLFALGTNMGIRQMAVTGEHGVGEAELRHVRAPPSSPARTCGRRSPPWSTPPLRPATPRGGARRPAPRRTPSGSPRGTPT